MLRAGLFTAGSTRTFFVALGTLALGEQLPLFSVAQTTQKPREGSD
jgi:hypothetical protein